MAKRKGKPILPKSRSNPVGQVQRIRKTRARFRKQIRSVEKWLLQTLHDIPRESIKVNIIGIFVNRYEYQISVPELNRIVEEINTRMFNMPKEFFLDQVRRSYEEGTGQAVANLSKITDDYTRTITQVLAGVPWQRRVALISARIFEDMQGFEAETGRELGRVLRQGIENGIHPDDISKDIRARFGVSKTRADRIARTEVTQALRRGRWDETTEAQERLDIRTKLLHISALSPTTRKTHAARHGGLYTVQQVREWYAEDANAINCKCTQVEVLVDSKGNPLTPDVVERVKNMKK